MAQAKSYRSMSVAEKEAHNRMHEPPVRCPDCDMAVQPEDLEKHMAERCQGRPEPVRQCRWISWSEATKLVSKVKLHRLVAKGKVRTRGEKGSRGYLYRDLVKCIASFKSETSDRERG